ncbi:MAG: hypothetical protein J5723_05980, partial [Ruminococcus sp.]|nr:hypothetical protein [Ruminococcus sp.]
MKKKNNNIGQQSNRKIKTVVDMLFDGIPYSEEVNKAQLKIEESLNAEYNKIKADRHEDEALEDLLSKYGRLSKMAELAGYPSESADKWRKKGEAVDIRPLKKEILKQRIRVYITALFVVFSLLQLFWFIGRVFVSPASALTNLFIVAIGILIASIPFRKYLKTEKAAEGKKYSTEAYKYLRSRSDKYSKRLLNSIALLFAMIFIFIFSELFFYIFGNSKSAEFTENAMKNSIAVEIPVFILLKNILCLRIFQRRIKIPDKEKYKKHIIGITVFSAVFWLGVTLFTFIMRNALAYPMNVFTVGGILFGLLMLIYNLTLRKKVTYKN